MKRVLGFLCFICLLGASKIYAQDHYVQGRVTNVTDGGAPFKVGTVNLYFTANRKEAEKIQKNLKKDHHYYDLRVQEVLVIQPDENGYYACEEAYEYGFIVADVGTNDIKIENIGGRSDVDMEIAV